MSNTSQRTLSLTPKIPAPDRSVLAQRRDPVPLLLGLLLVPLLSFVIAVADSRSGFRLLMTSLGILMLILALALFLRVRSLRAGVIRIDADGTLRFTPPAVIRALGVVVPLTFLLPVLAVLLTHSLGLPTQASSSRFLAAMPWLLVAVSLGSLAKELWFLRTPPGLRVSPEGLRGVRGTGNVDVGWEDLLRCSAQGGAAPKLSLLLRDRGAILLDAHQLGSAPDTVAAVIEFFRSRPEHRGELRDGPAAIRRVELLTGGRGGKR